MKLQWLHLSQSHFELVVLGLLQLLELLVLSTMEESSGFSEVSSSGLEITPGTTTTTDTPLPEYLTYLSLGFKWTATMIILLMACWVFCAIKNTRSLHKPHNIFVASLMITGMISAVLTCLQSSLMMIGFVTGLGDFISCSMFKFLRFPASVIYFTYIAISIDKVISIGFPFKHKKIMTPRAIGGIIVVTWLLAIATSIHVLFFNDGFTKVSQFGTCNPKGKSYISSLLNHGLPIFASSVIAAILNIYLAIKAYQVHKKIQEETRLSGAITSELKALKKRQAFIKMNWKPMITLMVVVLGSLGIGIFFPLISIAVKILGASKEISAYFIGSNIGYLVLLINPFVYGLYFKQVREPMMKTLRGFLCMDQCNTAIVAPQPRRTAWM